jgi:hypothetical protein
VAGQDARVVRQGEQIVADVGEQRSLGGAGDVGATDAGPGYWDGLVSGVPETGLDCSVSRYTSHVPRRSSLSPTLSATR